jgi:antirestriction protein ArdC
MKAKTYYEEVAETFIKALEQNTAPWQKPWKAGAGVGEEYNAKTGIEYKGINQLMLSLNNPTGGEDPRWMTFKQAQEEGYKVKKGAKGVQIVHFKFEDKRLVRDEETGEPILDKDGKKQYETVRLEKPIMSVSYVFHASQGVGVDVFANRLKRHVKNESRTGGTTSSSGRS